MAWTERTKPADTPTERSDTGGPGYDFSMTNIFWDRTDIYFDSTTTGPSQRTKPTDSAIERTKPTTNQCLSLNGSGYASIADGVQQGLDMGLSDFMIEGRMKLNVPSAGQPDTVAYFFSKYFDVQPYYEASLLSTTGRIVFFISGPANFAYITCSASCMDDLKWHNLVFVVDRDSVTGLKLFIDNIETTYIFQEDPTSVGDMDNSAEFAIGSEATSHDYKLNGLIDEVRIWNFGVDGLPVDYAAYIAWRHANPFAPTSGYNGGSWNTYVTNNLSTYYKFDGNYVDETSNSNDLTAGGSGNTFLNYSLERIKPTDTWTERTKPT